MNSDADFIQNLTIIDPFEPMDERVTSIKFTKIFADIPHIYTLGETFEQVTGYPPHGVTPSQRLYIERLIAKKAAETMATMRENLMRQNFQSAYAPPQ